MIKINWSFVDKVVYINLTKRTDRRESIEFQLKKIGVPQDKIIRFEAVENENGALGCTLSHIGVMTMAKGNNWNYFFISLIFSSWDAGLLSVSYFQLKQEHGCFYRLYFSYLTNSYIVNQHYYQTLRNVFIKSAEELSAGVPRHKCCLDFHWNALMKEDNWYAAYPCVGYQLVDQSDIEHIITDRTTSFARTLDEM